MKVAVQFRGGEIHRQGLGTKHGDYLEARVDYALIVGSRAVSGLHSTVRLSAGGSYGEPGLEVAAPPGYDGPWNHQGFGDCVERYVQKLVGGGGFISVAPGVTDVTLQDVYLGVPFLCAFDVDES